MFRNYTLDNKNYRSKNNPHIPTNIPENMENEVHSVFEHTESWSSQNGHIKFVYPKTKQGHYDYVYMLDQMGFEEGNIISYRNGERKMLVLERINIVTHWRKEFKIERGGVKFFRFDLNKTWIYSSKEEKSVKSLWKAYIYDDLEVVGNINDL